MPEQVIRVMTPVKARWDILTSRQKIQLVSATLLLLLALALFLFFTFRTTWVTLYANRDFTEISQVQAALDAEGIRNRPSPDWSSIEVPARNRTQATRVVHSNVAIAPSLTLHDAIDLTGLGTTEAERAQILLSSAQSDIEQVLIGMDGIVGASVNITPAERNLMLRPNQPQAGMGVMITTTRSFSQAEGRRMAELLRTMVLGLDLENITITDQHLNPIFMGGMTPESDSAMDVLNHRMRTEARILDSIEAAFTHSFDDVTVMGRFGYQDRIEQEERILVRTAPDGTDDGLPTFMQTSQSDAEGMLGINWGPGLGANMQASPAYQLGDPSLARASARDRTVSFDHNIHEIHTIRGPGEMEPERSNIAVMALRNTFIYETTFFERNPEATIEDWWYLEDTTPGSVLIADDPEVEMLRTWIALSTGLPIENIGVTITERFIFVPEETTPLPIPTIIMLAVLLLLIAMLIIALLARRKEEEEEEVEPELSVEDLLATTQLEEAKDEEARLKEIDYETENEIKKQIDKFVNEKPEAVAALLRNWLNAEEW
ncbi:MAG: hypothetical protein FWC16_10310 [Defluviitaleaceae bacterium]|nr:hypothetical protein [Defluviitaleaceae bacterium]MCL2275309.1 hypothetical protein [Defluviitaleaceae bacterium]